VAGWDTDYALELAWLGALGTEEEEAAEAFLEECAEGEHGEEAQAGAGEMLDRLDAYAEEGRPLGEDLHDNLLADEAAEPDGFSPEEIAAAEDRVRDAEATGYLEDQLDALEEKIGRKLTRAEEDRLLTADLVDAALAGDAVDLVAGHGEALKGRSAGEVRRELGADAVRQLREEHDTGFDASQLDGMNPRQLRVFRGEQAARFAQEGGTGEEWDAAKAAALAAEPSDQAAAYDDESSFG
jgi:hypothetical protein